MAIEFDCPACDATIRVKDNAAGKKGRCPKCKTLLLVPDPGPEETASDRVLDPAVPATAPPPEPEHEPEPVAQDTSVLDIPVESPADTLPIGPGNSWSPPADTLPLGVSADQADARLSEPQPDSPFPIVAEPPRTNGRVIHRHRRHKPPGRIVTVAVALTGLAALVGVGWYIYRATGPDLSATVTGERLPSVSLEATSFSPPKDVVPQEDLDAVIEELTREGLPLKSEYVSVLLTAKDGQIAVSVAPGPRSIAVRVPLGDHPSLRAALARNRDRIAELKQEELRTATADLFRDYAAYLEGGSPMTRLPEYRDQIALNAATGTVGYAVEAVVGVTPFPCVYEDSAGNCYFFPPDGTKTFHLRGRELADGSTPLPVDFEVLVREAPVPSLPATWQSAVGDKAESALTKVAPPDEKPEIMPDGVVENPLESEP